MKPPSVQFLASASLGLDVNDPETLKSLILETDVDTASLRVGITVEHVDDAALTAAVWSFCTGMAGRPVQITIGEQTFAPKPLPVPFESWVQSDGLEVAADTVLVFEEIAGAKSLMITNLTEADLELVMVLALLRKHPISGQWRFPSAEFDGTTVDLNLWHAAGAAARSKMSYRNTGDVAPVLAPDERRQQLIEAGSIPVADTLARLGCASNGTFFQCPRPLGHRTGDQDPSMQTKKGLGQCYVHDKSRVDSVQLIMNTLGLGPADAARFLVAAPDEVWEAAAANIADERASKKVA